MILSNRETQRYLPYLDDITVAGINQTDHDKNVEAFLDL